MKKERYTIATVDDAGWATYGLLRDSRGVVQAETEPVPFRFYSRARELAAKMAKELGWEVQS